MLIESNTFEMSVVRNYLNATRKLQSSLMLDNSPKGRRGRIPHSGAALMVLRPMDHDLSKFEVLCCIDHKNQINNANFKMACKVRHSTAKTLSDVFSLRAIRQQNKK
jgi:hypothetical protein